MRLSNIFIYSSVIIIIASAMGFLLVQSFGGRNPNRTAANPQLDQLQKTNKDLKVKLEQREKELGSQIDSLNDDLNRATNLLTEKDEEIKKLENQPTSQNSLRELCLVLNCSPEQVPERIKGLFADYQSLQQRFQLVNSQLSALQANATRPATFQADTDSETNDSTSQADADKKGNPNTSADQMALNSPENKKADSPTDDQLAQKGNQKTETREINPQPEAEDKKADNNKLVQIEKLSSEVDRLKAELQNREKLLYEQTSLIEDLKKSRVETGFRTGNNKSKSMVPVTPFRDRGTFSTKQRQ